MERAVFDRMAELDQDHWWFLARRRILKRLIERVARPPEKAKILEVGCGTGHNLAMLKSFGISRRASWIAVHEQSQTSACHGR